MNRYIHTCVLSRRGLQVEVTCQMILLYRSLKTLIRVAEPNISELSLMVVEISSSASLERNGSLGVRRSGTLQFCLVIGVLFTRIGAVVPFCSRRRFRLEMSFQQLDQLVDVFFT